MENQFPSSVWKNACHRQVRPFVPSGSTSVPFPETAPRFSLFLSSTRGRAVQRASQDSNQSLGRFVLPVFVARNCFENATSSSKRSALGLASVHANLPQTSGFDRVGAGFKVGCFGKVAPAKRPIFLALAFVQALNCQGGVLPAPDYFDHPTRLVRARVESNDGKGCLQLSIHSRPV